MDCVALVWLRYLNIVAEGRKAVRSVCVRRVNAATTRLFNGYQDALV